MAGSVATVIGLAGTFLLQSFTGLLGALDNAMLGIGIFSLPVCITFAISKYHLHDIDRIISHARLRHRHRGARRAVRGPGAAGHPVAVVPDPGSRGRLYAGGVRRCSIHCGIRVQLRVDRRFNRTRYDADQMVAAYAARLKDTVDLDSVRDDLAVAVHQALMPAHVTVWIKQDK